MTYDAIETSASDGRPLFLLEFTIDGVVYRYNTRSPDYDYGGNTYLGSSFRLTGGEQTGNIKKDFLTVFIPTDCALASDVIDNADDYLVTAKIYRLHANDGAQEAIVFWQGQLSDIQYDENEIGLILNSIFVSMRNPGLKEKYQRHCPYMLYEDGCGLNKDNFAIGATAGTVNGLSVDVAVAGGYSDGYFSAGMLEGADGRLRFIKLHVGTTITLSRPLPSLNTGDAITIYPGCDLTKETCNSKFSNLENFGGLPALPERNPYDGNSLF